MNSEVYKAFKKNYCRHCRFNKTNTDFCYIRERKDGTCCCIGFIRESFFDKIKRKLKGD